MKQRKLQISSEEDIFEAIFLLKEFLEKHGPFVMSLHEIVDLLTGQQRGFYWSRLRFFSEWNGNTKDWWHFWFKEKYFLPIYSRDLDNHPNVATLIKAMQHLKKTQYEDYPQMRQLAIEENISHLDATTKNMQEVLDAQSDVAMAHNINLPPARYSE